MEQNGWVNVEKYLKKIKHSIYFAGFFHKIVYFEFMKHYNVSELQAWD